jgi:hypothetical protein
MSAILPGCHHAYACNFVKNNVNTLNQLFEQIEIVDVTFDDLGGALPIIGQATRILELLCTA